VRVNRGWWLAGLGALAVGGWRLRELPVAFGGRPDVRRMRRSAQFRDGAFHNVARTTTMPPGTLGESVRELLFGGQQRKPAGPVPLVTPPLTPADRGLHVTWYGHASTMVEIDGERVLFDPMWSERASPSDLAGPRRLHRAPVPLAELPPLTAVVISHDHYDHLDLASIRTLVQTQRAPFLVPLGVGAHLRRWKVPAERIIELDWSERAEVGGLSFTATAAQHFSGRFFKRDNTLWASWVVAGAARKVFYTGDSGYFPGYAEIGREHGPFDLALVQIGAYAPGWPDIHMTPEEGVAAHLEVGARLLVPVHWCTFNLALHAWTEPVDRVWREAKARGVTLAVPRPGERIDVDDPPAVSAWWQSLG
jgi:L-ascorbate metabolism protein UlaG (beta-lactamase superfamily)